MNNPTDKEQELEQKERELRERERQIRLREMEDELYQKEAPLYETSKYSAPEKASPPWYRKLIRIGKFAGIVVAVVAAAYIGVWVAAAILVLTVAFVGYKIMFSGNDEGNKENRK